ncbi:hypothetical protein LEN26_015026 [Aphanomyces euteiches]|nr:hypothetical protein LEN26_015026 [Aphanomyces euteiches]KAH9115246.1 hypothetical protein AeMF1_010726 [Aphanomyces euteiches]
MHYRGHLQVVKTTEFAYDFAGSINVAAVETPAMGLRVDIDTFLTPVCGWPAWHDGVFAGHLAIHDCTTSVGGFHKRDNIMDYPKFETDDVSLHAHVLYWESMDDFSKTKFVLGHNKRIDVETLDPARVNQFALQLALQANRVDYSAVNQRSIALRRQIQQCIHRSPMTSVRLHFTSESYATCVNTRQSIRCHRLRLH